MDQHLYSLGSQVVQTLVPFDLGTLLTLAGLGGGTALAVQVIKKAGKLDEAKKTVMFLLAFLGYAATWADWLVQYSNQNPKLVIGAHLATVISLAVFFHRFAVSPAYPKVMDGLGGFLNKLQPASAPTAPATEPAAAPQPAPQAQEFSIPA